MRVLRREVVHSDMGEGRSLFERLEGEIAKMSPCLPPSPNDIAAFSPAPPFTISIDVGLEDHGKGGKERD